MINKNPDKLSEQIDSGVKIAIREAIERHGRLGESISILKDGKFVTLTSDQIPQSLQLIAKTPLSAPPAVLSG